MNKLDRRQLTSGAIAVVLAVGFFALILIEGLSEAALLYLMGGMFVMTYLALEIYAPLVAGGILLGIGLGMVGDRSPLSVGDIRSIGLGIGFEAVYVIAVVSQGRSHWWPLIPGLVFLVGGIALGGLKPERLFPIGWPLILFFIGLSLLFAVFGLTRQREEEEDDDDDED